MAVIVRDGVSGPFRLRSYGVSPQEVSANVPDIETAISEAQDFVGENPGALVLIHKAILVGLVGHFLDPIGTVFDDEGGVS